MVGEGADGAEAVELAKEHRPALMLLDVSMPGTDGLEALPRVVEESPDTRVVMFTGFEEHGLAERAPGRAVEVRVPPFAAIQCVEGQRHTRGTPPNVVEMDATTWLRLATGRLSWADAVAEARLSASGTRADLSPYLPLF